MDLRCLTACQEFLVIGGEEAGRVMAVLGTGVPQRAVP